MVRSHEGEWIDIHRDPLTRDDDPALSGFKQDRSERLGALCEDEELHSEAAANACYGTGFGGLQFNVGGEQRLQGVRDR